MSFEFEIGVALEISRNNRLGCALRKNRIPIIERSSLASLSGMLLLCKRRSNLVKATKVLNEFKSFIARGNVMDLAVGVIIGGAFGLIVTSLVNDIVMPLVGVVFGGFDFSNYFIPLSDKVTAVTLAEARKQGAVFAYGNFLTVVINFVILAWIIFLMVKGVNTMRKQLERQEKSDAKAAPPPADVQLLTEIRDLLKAKSV
jgi:large conductance mechanosensitive channel